MKIGNIAGRFKHVRIYVHMPGHSLRKIKNNFLVQYELRDVVFIQSARERVRHVNISISKTVVVNNRAQAKEKCNPDVWNQDKNILTWISKKFGCIPSYWKPFLTFENDLRECTSLTDYEKIHDYINVLILRKC